MSNESQIQYALQDYANVTSSSEDNDQEGEQDREQEDGQEEQEENAQKEVRCQGFLVGKLRRLVVSVGWGR